MHKATLFNYKPSLVTPPEKREYIEDGESLVEPIVVKPTKGRLLVKLVKEIADEKGLQVKTFSGDWIISLKAPDDAQLRYIWGYSFGLNSQVASRICDDKASLCDILKLHEIPHIEHQIFLSPNLAEYTKESGVTDALFRYAEKHNYNIVLKPKDGSGGNGVVHCKNKRDVESQALKLWSKDYSFVASPFEPIEDEYRTILLDNEVKFVFKKVRPFITGDGQCTIGQLIAAELARSLENEESGLIKINQVIQSLMSGENTSKNLDLEKIPEEGERVSLIWKHNLAGGAEASIDIEDETKANVTQLALQAGLAVGARFMSVDIAKIGLKYKVLEINSGVMMEKMPSFVLNGEQIAKKIYEEAITKMFEYAPIPTQIQTSQPMQLAFSEEQACSSSSCGM